MKFKNRGAELFVPDGTDGEASLRRTTHLAVGAHQDDLEIMAVSAVLECFQNKDKWFCGVVVTDGRGSPRSGPYQSFSDQQMSDARKAEQRKAAVVGEYGSLVQLDYPSAAVKDGKNRDLTGDLTAILAHAAPDVVLTHNLADKHDTHVGVALRVVEALRTLPPGQQPKRVLGCEVWRGLDWLVDDDKVLLDCSPHENLQAALLGLFDTQISGGKRYDLAAQARLRANATYFQSHEVDKVHALAFAMDLTPLVRDRQMDIASYVAGFIDRLRDDVNTRLAKMKAV